MFQVLLEGFTTNPCSMYWSESLFLGGVEVSVVNPLVLCLCSRPALFLQCSWGSLFSLRVHMPCYFVQACYILSLCWIFDKYCKLFNELSSSLRFHAKENIEQLPFHNTTYTTSISPVLSFLLISFIFLMQQSLLCCFLLLLTHCQVHPGSICFAHCVAKAVLELLVFLPLPPQSMYSDMNQHFLA